MHKLILSFKGKILKVFQAESHRCYIGREEDCDIQIDNLAVAAHHIKFHFSDEQVTFDILETGSTLLLNHKQLDQQTGIKIQPGDEIAIGKHVLCYQWEDIDAHEEEEETKDEVFTTAPKYMENGWLQVLSGPKMGRTMHLNKVRIRIGNANSKGAMITSRPDGYYLSSLDNTQTVKLNNQGIDDDSVNLQDGNTIQIGDTEMLFFIQQ